MREGQKLKISKECPKKMTREKTLGENGQILKQISWHCPIKNLVHRAMRKEDNSPQGKIVTELLQHLHQVKIEFELTK